MRQFVLIVALLTQLGLPVLAQAQADVEARLNAALKKLDNVTADFKQTVLDDQKKIVQQSSGRVAISRPGKFSWIYTSPYEQKIIGDGVELWVYDVELDQVTVKPIEAGLANAPIMILMKQSDITADFTVSEVGQRKYLYWVSLEPKTSELEFSQVYIGLENEVVKAMELRDSFGQSTQIVFENLRTNVVHRPETFTFVPPEGVDVFGVGG